MRRTRRTAGPAIPDPRTAVERHTPPPTPRRPIRILRCDACEKSFDCTAADVVRYVQTGWPACCGYDMRQFVEGQLPTPKGMRRPATKQ
jgi:hypothetical protein